MLRVAITILLPHYKDDANSQHSKDKSAENKPEVLIDSI